MDVVDLIILVLAFFQFAGGTRLFWARTPAPAGVSRALGALLVLNGLVAVGLLLDPTVASWVGVLTVALDTLTTPLLLAALALRYASRPAPWLVLLGVAGAAQTIAWLAVPTLRSGASDDLLRAIPYYVALGALVLASAASKDEWQRWVALAFLPRAAEFGLLLFVPGDRTPTGMAQAVVAVLLIPAVVLATILLLRRASPPRAATVSLALLGPALFLARAGLPPGSTEALLNLVTLALVRPLFVYVALVPALLPRLALLSAGCGAVAFAVAGFAQGALALPEVPTILLGLGIGLMAFAFVEAYRPRAESAATASDAPHWQRLIVALRGSSRRGDPEAAWTQIELARATGIGIRRVSEFPKLVNGTSEAKLDLYVPGWRAERPAGPAPLLVTTHKGTVAGMPGVRLYYRLTPAGEKLAAAVQARAGLATPEPVFDGQDGSTPAGVQP